MDNEDGLTSDLLRALRRRGVSMLCPACEWPLDGPLGNYRLIPDDEDEVAGHVHRGIKVQVFACRNCGYVRLHSANVLKNAQPRSRGE